MSLQQYVHTINKQTVPIAALQGVLESDKVVVENIMICAQDQVHEINLQTARVHAVQKMYKVTLRIPSPSVKITLGNLRAIESCSPARIHDMHVSVEDASGLVLTILVGNEQSKIKYTEYDTIRICKRTRIENR